MLTSENAKTLLALHGEVRAQPPSEWKGTFAIPPAVEIFYRDVGPVDVLIEAHGNPFFLPRLARLWDFQAGYRWNGVSGEPIRDWDDDWLVVADQGGDPFIILRSTGAVLFALHGQGDWEAVEMFPDLNTMAACLALLGSIVVDAGDEFLDDECNIRPEYRSLASERLRELLGSESRADAILANLEWS